MNNPSNMQTRPKRRLAKARQFDTSVASPCTQVCQFADDEFCVGCRRTQDEIREWIIMTREEKLAVLEKIKTRARSTP